jgi:gliding motility-associated-like protein
MIYAVTGIDINGCSSLDSVSIIVNAPENVSAGNDTSICFGESTTLHATGGNNYTWSPAESLSDSTSANPIATPPATTIFFVNEISVSGCGGKDSVVVTVISLPIVKASDDTTICSGDTVQLIASGASLYVWSPSNTLNNALIANPLAFPSQNTLYTVTGINLSGCKNSDSVLISIFNTNAISAGVDTSVCIGDTIQLNASGADKYSWSPSQFLSDVNSANPKCFPTSSTVFILTATLGNCSVIDSVIVIVNALPPISAGKDTSVCIGSSVQLNASGGIKYSWSPGEYLSDSLVANPFASPPYEFEYTVIGTDVHGCSNTDQVSIQVFAVPEVIISVDSAMCDGDTIPMSATGGTNYHWEPPLGLSQTEFASTLVYPPVTTTYTVTVTNQFGCTTTASAKVTVNELPNVSAGSDQFVCPGIGVQLQATGALYYFWTPSTGLSNNNSSNPIATVYSNTTYVVTGIDVKNCHATDTVNLVLLPPLQSFISNDTIICSGSTAHLNAGGGISYQWLPSNSLSDAAVASPIATPSESTTYDVYVSDGICYTDTLNVTVTVQPLPTINAGADADIISGVAYNFNVQSSEGNYSWLPSDGLSCSDCPNPTATPKQTTTYVVTVTDSIGCSSSDSITLTVGCGDDVVFVPNAFTPNDNNHNDVLYIRALGTIDLHFFRVYDRWGKMIFNTSNLDLGWNGKYNAKPMPAGVYLYEWELTCSNGDVVKKQGNVTLLR